MSGMYQKAPTNGARRPLRRSTRLRQAVAFTVTGVDAYRGPYCEQVTAETFSCHGCRYKSKHDVPIDSEVMLELKSELPGEQAVFARGVVKSLERPREGDQNILFSTSIELEEPGNIWNIVSPPEDWLSFCHSRKPMRVYLKPTPPVVPDAVTAIVRLEDTSRGELYGDRESIPSLTPIERPLSQIMVSFQRQIEEMLSEAAAAAAQKEAVSLRQGLREEAAGILVEAAAAHFEKHDGEHAALSKSISESCLDQLRTSVEACRQNAVDRIVARLKEQLAAPLEEARAVTRNLAKAKQDLEKILGDFAQTSSARVEELRTHFERQIEASIREHLRAADAELGRAGQSMMLLTLDRLGISAKQREALARVHLNETLDQVSETALMVLKERSASISRESLEALTTDSRRNLESVGNAISELAKGIGKRSLLL